MLALASSQPYHTSRPPTQSWRGKDKQPMKNHSIARSHSVSAASSSSSPRSHFASRKSTSASSRRGLARDVLEPASTNQDRTSACGTSQPRLVTSQPPLPVAQTSTPPPSPPVLDIVNYPSTELLKLLAALLQQIATANDALREATHHRRCHPPPLSPSASIHPEGSSGESSMFSASHLSPSAFNRATALFHARNVPTISIESYLLRILKYCPTTNEVFLSLLVYFDRMSRGTSDHAGIAIDSYNVHRLVIAGITVASKFFSDVFYLNSRYAKVCRDLCFVLELSSKCVPQVGGLPQTELNQLELQFLLLNDFRLLIQPEEMQRYANQLLVYSTTLHPPSPTSPLPPPITTTSATNERSIAPSDTLPTPVSSPQTQIEPPQRHPNLPFSQPAHFRAGSFEEAEESSGYGTTDDEPTIKPSDSSGSSIHTVSSTATSQATTPATSPARRAMARLSSQSSTSSFSSGHPHVQDLGDDRDEDADTDGEGDETDDESLYRAGGRASLSRESAVSQPSFGRRISTDNDANMRSP